MKILYALGFCIFLLTPIFSSAQTQVEQQQVIPGELPDPSIIEVDGVYYATGTTGDWAPIYPIYKSTDLNNWELISAVFQEKPKWTMGSFWAPELYYDNGTFYCYYTARGTDGVSKVGVATTKDIAKGFKDKGVIIDWGDEAIDAYVYKENNTTYITWKAYGLTPDKPITILGAKLSDDLLELDGEEFTVVTAEVDNWERGGIEGQAIVKRGDYLYMLYSGNACCGKDCDYMVGVARAKSMKGPWIKHEQNPILVGNADWKCPGHGTAVQKDNKWYYLYHAYNSKGFPSLGRAAVLSEIYWDEQSGWPYFNVAQNLVDGERLEKNIEDDFGGSQLKKHWKYNVKNGEFKTKVKNSTLTLTESKPDAKNPTGAVLCVIPDDSDFTFATQVVNTNSALKGLVLYTTKDNSIGLGTKDDKIILWKVQDGMFIEMDSKPLKNASAIWLKAKVTNSSAISFSFSTDGNSYEDLYSVNGDNLAWWSSGMKVGLQIRKDGATGDDEGVFEEFRVKY